MDTREAYLELLKGCLTRALFTEDEKLEVCKLGLEDWPVYAETMIGTYRLDNIRYCIGQVIKDKVEGDVIECGVWRGGACIWMKAILDSYEELRNVYVADSFNGFPKPKYKCDADFDFLQKHDLKVPVEVVKNNFKKYGLLDNRVKFIEGYFSETLPKFDGKLALLRVDGDLYESTVDILNNLYDKVSVGGYIIIDDYQLGQCELAVQFFRRKRNITDKIENIDGGVGVFWRKTQ
jgi:hypothetical protein